jgi:hypothetical protein
MKKDLKPIFASAIVTAGVTLGALAGCASSPADAKGDSPAGVIVQELPDGKSVICVAIIRGADGATLSCDWDHVR